MLAAVWVRKQEQAILKDGAPLDPAQLVDARKIGLRHPESVRLLAVSAIPLPVHPLLMKMAERTGLISPDTIGMTLQYGIYIRSDYWGERRLVVHELTHTAQYERLGGIRPFLAAYLGECLTPPGYPFGPLEQEAKAMEHRICDA
jgi:hypothetical protein